MSVVLKGILSTAHEVVQCLPLTDKKYKCLRCGVSGAISTLYSEESKCHSHLESLTSGWRGPIVDVVYKYKQE